VLGGVDVVALVRFEIDLARLVLPLWGRVCGGDLRPLRAVEAAVHYVEVGFGGVVDKGVVNGGLEIYRGVCELDNELIEIGGDDVFVGAARAARVACAAFSAAFMVFGAGCDAVAVAGATCGIVGDVVGCGVSLGVVNGLFGELNLGCGFDGSWVTPVSLELARCGDWFALFDLLEELGCPAGWLVVPRGSVLRGGSCWVNCNFGVSPGLSGVLV
jgi:hypothetical protein